MMMTKKNESIAPWATLDAIAVDYRFPYQVAGPRAYEGYLSLFDRYADSGIGEVHCKQVPRFVADFGYDEENNYQQMVKDLGFNAHPRDHMQSASVATNALFLRAYAADELVELTRWLPMSDIPVVRLVNPLHDVGENASPTLANIVGGVIGDIAHGKKTARDKLIESQIRKVIFDKFYSDLPADILQRVEDICSHAEDSPAHQTYVWGHELEALQTAMLAANHVQRVDIANTPRDYRYLQLKKLASEVGNRTIEELQPATTHFSYIRDVLGKAGTIIGELE